MNNPSTTFTLLTLVTLGAIGCGEVGGTDQPFGFTWRDTESSPEDPDSSDGHGGASEGQDDSSDDGALDSDDGDGDGDGDIETSAQETGIGDGDGDGDGDTSSVCLEQSFTVEIVRPQLGLVLDHSGSMNASFNGILNRWQVLHDTTVELADRYEDRADFGVVVFPNYGDWCEVDVTPALEMGPHSSIEVAWSIPLRDADASGGTPLAQAYDSAELMIMDADPSRPRALIIIADGGVDSCEGDTAQTIADDAAVLLGSGIETFVVGIGALDALDAIADAGGTGTTIPADDQPALHAAMEAVIGGAVSCDLNLDAAPPAMGELVLMLGGTQLSRETSCLGDGWVLSGPETIELCGVSCDAYREGATVELELICSAG